MRFTGVDNRAVMSKRIVLILRKRTLKYLEEPQIQAASSSKVQKSSVVSAFLVCIVDSTVCACTRVCTHTPELTGAAGEVHVRSGRAGYRSWALFVP